MALELIGAGFGRTGTLSQKLALETLGIGPCYHMFEVVANPAHVENWNVAARGGSIDWEDLFRDYRATVDWPGCRFWRELTERYPESKVLLSVRNAESWYESVHETIYQAMTRPHPEGTPQVLIHQRNMANQIVLEETFGGRFLDRGYAIEVFEAHNRAVQDAIPPEKLLIYEVKEGWEPLCAFLDRPIPNESFPRVNERDFFREQFGLGST